MMRAMMKMAAVSTVTLFLLCCSVVPSADSQSSCDQHSTVGDNVTVPLNRQPAATDTLRWTHGSDIIFIQKNTEVVSKKLDTIGIYGNGSLKLINVMKSNAGKYTPEIFKDGVAERNLKSTDLCVWDPVQKPQVKTECLDSKSKVKFTCIITQNTKDLKVEWLLNNKEPEKAKGLSLTKVAKEVAKDSFTCRVSNLAKGATSDPVTQNCYKPFIPEKVLGISIWVFVGGGAGVVVVLIIVVIVCCVCTRRKKRMRLKEEGELRLEWTNPQEQRHPQHHPQHPPDHYHHHHHQQQQPAGSTGPRQNRSKQQRNQQRLRAPEPPNSLPQPSPRRAAQAPRPVNNPDDEQPPPLPQPRKKAPRTQRV